MKINHTLTILSLSTALLLGFAGCSSDDSNTGDGDNLVSVSYSGIGIDGLLVGSTVCIDANENNLCDVGEPSAITDDKGKFNIAKTTVTGPLLLVGGIDDSTGEAFKGQLKAPSGSTVVTPLTSAVQSLVENGKSAEDAEQAIKVAMGLSDVNVSLTSFDPYNGIDSDPLNAQKILAKQTQLQVLVHTASATVAGADSGTDVGDVMSNVFDAIVESMDTGAEVELTADLVAIATREAAAETFKDKTVAEKNALVVAVGTVADEEAKDAVLAANGAKDAIESGEASDALVALDGAIKEVNKEDGSATADAVTAQTGLTPEELADTVAAREARDAAAKKQAAAEAKALAARAAAEKALLDAATKDELEAAQRLQAEAAAAEKLAAEAAAAEAQARADRAAAEAAAALITAQEKADQEAAAQAAKEAADAEALQAEIAQEAAEAAAQAAADADTLAEAEAAAEAAAKAAEDARAADLIASLKVSAQNAITDAEAVVALIQEIKDQHFNVDDKLTAGTTTVAEMTSLVAEIDALGTDIDGVRAKKDEVLAKLLLVEDALGEAESIKSASILLSAKVNRIEDLYNSVQIMDQNATTTIASVNTEASVVQANITEIKNIANQYPTDIQSISDATDASLATLEASYDLSVTYATTIKTQLGLIEPELSNYNETAAVEATDLAIEAFAQLKKELVIIDEEAQKIEAYLIQARVIKAQKDAESTTSPVVGFTVGMIISEFDEDNGHFKLSTHELGANNELVEGRYDFNITSKTFELSTQADLDTDYILNANNVWVEDNSNSYTLDNGILVFSSGMEVKIMQTIDLVTPAPTDVAIVADINGFVPGEGNIFSTGAEAYLLGFKEPAGYRLWEPVTKCNDWNSTTDRCNVAETEFNTLLSMMLENYSITGAEDSTGKWIGVDFARNMTDINSTSFHDLAILDSEGNDVNGLSVNQNGSLVIWDYGTHTLVENVGTWIITQLPGENGLAIEIAPATDFEYLFDDDNLFAVLNNTVYRGNHSLDSTEFTTDHDLEFNEVATTDVKNAIISYYSAMITNTLSGKTLWGESEAGTGLLETLVFNDTATVVTWTELDDTSCNGTASVAIDEDTKTVTFKAITDNCLDENESIDTTADVFTFIGIGDDYIEISSSNDDVERLFFTLEGAQANYPNGAVSTE